MAGASQVNVLAAPALTTFLSAAGRALADDWRASGLYGALLPRHRAEGFRLRPRDFRPADANRGKQILAGVFVLEGQTLSVGVRGDPWDRPAPSRAFAEALHRFDWLPDLVAAGPEGPVEALRLVLEWRRIFGRRNAFAWAPAIVARRLYNLSCAGPALCAQASDAETHALAADCARHAALLLDGGPAETAAARAAAAATAGVALAGRTGQKLTAQALRRLAAALGATLDDDGGHASRRADLALELLYDLQTLDEALTQLGLAAPVAVQRAIDRLAANVRFSTLDDGALATFHGGGAASPERVAGARAQDETGDCPTPVQLGGYHRMDGVRLQVMADGAPPPAEPWSTAACDHPLSLAVLVDGRRLIDPACGRTIEQASTAQVGPRSPVAPLSGSLSATLGSRLVGARSRVEALRHEGPGAVWLDLAYQGWLRRYGLIHQRRLFLDLGAHELRGEDRLTPTARVQGPDGRHFIPYALRFQLHPGVHALVSRDQRSVLLRLEGDTGGWVLRNDVLAFALEPADRPGRPAQQLVLRGQRRADSGVRVRWKLSPAVAPPLPPVDGPAAGT